MLTQEDFLHSYDFMKLGQAIEHGNWQVAGMTAARIQRNAKEAEVSDFDRQIISLKQCIGSRQKLQAQNILAAIITKRVQMLKKYENK